MAIMLRRFCLGLFVVALSTVTTGLTGVARAVPPINDDFDNAIVIGSLPFSDRRNPRPATTATDDPRCHGRDKTLWYSYTSPSGRWIRAETAGSRYDTALSVYTGDRGNLTQVICDDEGGPFHTSRVTIRLEPQVTYYFMIGANARTGLGRLVFSVRRAKPACLNRKATIVGTDGNDTITGTRQRDVIVGLRGDDSIRGRGGRDIICGNEGSDSIHGQGKIEGGEDGDTITVPPGAVLGSIINGDDGDDMIAATFGSDRITGGEGSDTLQGGQGKDFLMDDSKDDDHFSGGAAADIIEVGEGDDVIEGGPGRDSLRYGERVRGVNVNLTTGVVTFGTSTQSVAGIEAVKGTEVPDVIVGSAGDDELLGGGGVDSLSGEGGDDLLDGGDGGSTVFGGEGDDLILTRLGRDTISGDAGNDSIRAGAGDDNIDGGDGVDLIKAGAGIDSVSGGESADEIYGAAGDDDVDGDAGDDFIKGLTGNDQLDGGDGVDSLNGGAGTDSCVNGESQKRCEG